MEFLDENSSIWLALAAEERPIVLYGMGDGADKILTVFERYGITASAVFASDEFVRGHSFRGFPVERLRDVTARLGEDICIVIAFASQRPEILERMDALDNRFDVVVAPDVPVAGDELFTLEFVRKHKEDLQHAYALMADEQSRLVFENTVRYKLTGKLRYLRCMTTEKRDVFENLLRPCGQEHFIDLGAYNGDTIRELLSYTDGKYASITAFEPDRKNYKKLKKYVDTHLSGNVELLCAGAWDGEEEQIFSSCAGRNSRLGANGAPVQMRSVDSVLDGRTCTLLKMDVEGAERRAIQGAKKTIAQYRPRLNVAAYHRSEDFFALPLLLHTVCPAYKLYLRHHPYVPAWDTNLYAVAD